MPTARNSSSKHNTYFEGTYKKPIKNPTPRNCMPLLLLTVMPRTAVRYFCGTFLHHLGVLPLLLLPPGGALRSAVVRLVRTTDQTHFAKCGLPGWATWIVLATMRYNIWCTPDCVVTYSYTVLQGDTVGGSRCTRLAQLELVLRGVYRRPPWTYVHISRLSGSFHDRHPYIEGAGRAHLRSDVDMKELT